MKISSSSLLRFFCIAWAGIVPAVKAEVRLPAIFGDHMVLQRDIDLSIWGTAEAGEKVVVAIAGQTADTTADSNGHWTVKLAPLAKEEKPTEMIVKGQNEIVFRDILVGDVWLCSGQSNMQFGLQSAHNGPEALSRSDNPQIRFFLVKKKVAFSPQEDCEGKWMVCNPENISKVARNGFSAVGYFFGSDIQSSQGVPVGLLGSYLGGTPAQAWTSLDALQSVASLAHHARNFEQTKTNLSDLMKKYRDETLPAWEAANTKEEAANATKIEGDETPSPVRSRKPVPPDNDHHLASVLFNGMVAPIMTYGIKGVIWYQGEANSGAAEEYAVLFPALIADWRSRWRQGDFPFLFVQLAGYGPGRTWPVLRNSQLKALSLPNTGMALAIDIGEEKDIHPKNKMDVGRRLALVARAVAYGEKIVYSGPIYQSMKPEDGKVRVKFNHVGGGLMIGAAPPIRMDETPKAPLDRLVGFELAGADGKFVSANAKIDGEDILVWNDAVSDPKAVRYGWAAFPEANLYNKEKLPASPFSSVSSH